MEATLGLDGRNRSSTKRTGNPILTRSSRRRAFVPPSRCPSLPSRPRGSPITISKWLHLSNEFPQRCTIVGRDGFVRTGQDSVGVTYGDADPGRSRIEGIRRPRRMMNGRSYPRDRSRHQRRRRRPDLGGVSSPTLSHIVLATTATTHTFGHRGHHLTCSDPCLPPPECRRPRSPWCRRQQRTDIHAGEIRGLPRLRVLGQFA